MHTYMNLYSFLVLFGCFSAENVKKKYAHKNSKEMLVFATFSLRCNDDNVMNRIKGHVIINSHIDFPSDTLDTTYTYECVYRWFEDP